MNAKSIYFKRVVLSLTLGLLFGVAVTEIPIFLIHKTARSPMEIVLTIPNGTAKQVARGEQPATIPLNMTFVLGDTLVVNNEDSIDHKLGPLWVPAGSSASLFLKQAESFAFECSFQTGNYLGIEVREPLTVWTHLAGILGAGIPLGVLVALYSIVLPVKNKEHASA